MSNVKRKIKSFVIPMAITSGYFEFRNENEDDLSKEEIKKILDDLNIKVFKDRRVLDKFFDFTRTVYDVFNETIKNKEKYNNFLYIAPGFLLTTDKNLKGFIEDSFENVLEDILKKRENSNR